MSVAVCFAILIKSTLGWLSCKWWNLWDLWIEVSIYKAIFTKISLPSGIWNVSMHTVSRSIYESSKVRITKLLIRSVWNLSSICKAKKWSASRNICQIKIAAISKKTIRCKIASCSWGQHRLTERIKAKLAYWAII